MSLFDNQEGHDNLNANIMSSVFSHIGLFFFLDGRFTIPLPISCGLQGLSANGDPNVWYRLLQYKAIFQYQLHNSKVRPYGIQPLKFWLTIWGMQL